MRTLWLFLAAAGLLTSAAISAEPAAEPSATPAGPTIINFRGTDYLYRWSKDNQYEFTPAGQEDLEKWTDMLTVNYYGPRDGDTLAASANAVVKNYEKAGAKILRTNSRPATKDTFAEHLIIGIFAQPAFVEAAFTRFYIVKGTGLTIVYSHRIYGKEAADQMSDWLKQHGARVEASLMRQEVPLADSIRKE